MFLKNSSARSLALGALLLSLSALCLTGCGGSKPADGGAGGGDAKAGGAGSAPLAPDAGAAKDQQIQKEVSQEKGLKEEAGGGGGGKGGSDK